MITQLLFSVLMWFVETMLGLVSFAVPEPVLEWVAAGFGWIGHMLSFGPAGIVAIVFVAYLAWDTLLNGLVFAFTTYRMIPFKGT